MLRIKDWNTAYWGRIPTASAPFPCHQKVNAFVGASGSGKTTLMDAFRLTLGDARFENNRPMDHYIHPTSNWAVVRVAFWNRWAEGRPFARVGFQDDEVTVCVRLDRSSGENRREYYMFDGPFHNMPDLGQNPRLYRQKQIDYKEYLDKMAQVGLTRAFRRLMTIRPEDVQNVVQKPPHELFELIFDLKGTKEVRDEHARTRERMRELDQQEQQTERDLLSSQEKLREYEEKKRLFEENEGQKRQHGHLTTVFLKRVYWDTANDLQDQRGELAKLRDKHADQVESQKQLEVTLAEIQRHLMRAGEQVKDTDELWRGARKTENEEYLELDRATRDVKAKNTEIERLQSIPEADLPSLEHAALDAQHEEDRLRLRRAEASKRCDDLKGEISRLESGQSVLPRWVTPFQDSLAQKQVPAVMMADCISVREEYLPWLEAIEGLLGRERYRTIVPATYQLAAKKLQEQYEYGARVSLPKGPRQKTETALLEGKYPTLRSALQVDSEDIVGGYLEHLNRIYLVDTVEEGHALQQEGYTTLTRRGLLQDSDGAVFLRVQETVCGRVGRERHLQLLRDQYAEVDAEYLRLDAALNQTREHLRDLTSRIQAQTERLSLSSILVELEQLRDKQLSERADYEAAKEAAEQRERSYKEAQAQEKQLAVLQGTSKTELTAIAGAIGDMQRSIQGYVGNVGKLEGELEKAKQELNKAGFDEHALAFLEAEVQEGLFRRIETDEWTRPLLEARLGDLARAMDEFAHHHTDINRGVIAMVEPQKKRVSALDESLQTVRREKQEWEERLATAEHALRAHVKEIMDQYIEEFAGLAALLGSKGEGKLEQEGANFEQWRLQLRIGFDGKKPKPYFDPEFSSGQRAAISIMLILAAVNNQREGTTSSLMLLDEPTSRVDDSRGNEIGALLQKTQIQYFITHQISASLSGVDWIDHAYVVSKAATDDGFAPLPVFEARRTA